MKRTITGLLALIITAVVWANDGGLTFGGTPKLLTSHPSVRMVSEVIKMTVGKETVKVDCTFVFQNEGDACKVKMGFPDQGEGADNPDEEYGDDWKDKPPVATFKTFVSYIDGEKVETKLERSEEPGLVWHTKTVSFPKDGKRIVRDIYTVAVGSQLGDQCVYHQAYYILHTGASWKGKIGSTEVIVTFKRDIPESPILATDMNKMDVDIWAFDWSGNTQSVYYRAPVKPTVNEKTLKFVKKNWEPTTKDNIYLCFDNQAIPMEDYEEDEGE